MTFEGVVSSEFSNSDGIKTGVRTFEASRSQVVLIAGGSLEESTAFEETLKTTLLIAKKFLSPHMEMLLAAGGLFCGF